MLGESGEIVAERELSKNRPPRQGADLACSAIELLRACANAPLPFALLGDGAGAWSEGRSVVGCAPSAVLSVAAGGTAIVTSNDRVERWTDSPLQCLQRFVDRFEAPEDEPDEIGFVAVALSYELRRTIERLPKARPIAADQLILHAAVYDWLASFDEVHRTWNLHRRPGADVDLHAVERDLRRRLGHTGCAVSRLRVGPLRPEFTATDHRNAVERALAYIAAGDIYQVNVAQRFRSDGPCDPVALLTAWQATHPVPFGAYVDTGAGVLVSNSPECLLRIDGSQVRTYPIKGTRPRAPGQADRALAQELRGDPKERAEHVMIVDLERNDLGRVCTTGSIEVRDLMRVQSFPSLHHLVSEVRGTLRPRVSLAEILHATFPGGSITGAPKIRAMEIIDEIESHERGFYTGAVGLVGRRWARLNIAIRTAWVTPAALIYHAGGGIVADSDPQREYEEILLKTRSLEQVLTAAPHASAA